MLVVVNNTYLDCNLCLASCFSLCICNYPIWRFMTRLSGFSEKTPSGGISRGASISCISSLSDSTRRGIHDVRSDNNVKRFISQTIHMKTREEVYRVSKFNLCKLWCFPSKVKKENVQWLSKLFLKLQQYVEAYTNSIWTLMVFSLNGSQ